MPIDEVKKDSRNTVFLLNNALQNKILIIFFGTIIVSFIIKNTDDPLPYLDAFTTVSSLVATYYMMKIKIDTWVIWFINDIFYENEKLDLIKDDFMVEITRVALDSQKNMEILGYKRDYINTGNFKKSAGTYF